MPRALTLPTFTVRARILAVILVITTVGMTFAGISAYFVQRGEAFGFVGGNRRGFHWMLEVSRVRCEQTSRWLKQTERVVKLLGKRRVGHPG